MMATAWQKAMRRGAPTGRVWRVQSARAIRAGTCEIEIDRGRDGFLVARRYPDGGIDSVTRLTAAEKQKLTRLFDNKCPR
jgi:hypothetical protein